MSLVSLQEIRNHRKIPKGTGASIEFIRGTLIEDECSTLYYFYINLSSPGVVQKRQTYSESLSRYSATKVDVMEASEDSGRLIRLRKGKAERRIVDYYEGR